MGDDGVWSNCTLWAIMRGTSYQPWTLQPEALTDEQCRILRETMDFARKYENIFFNGKCFMIGGNPRYGEIYGFVHPLDNGELTALRNPLPIPQIYPVPESQNGETLLQIYPDCRAVGTTLVFAPHEVKILQKTTAKVDFGPLPFQHIDGRYYYPASATVSETIAPMVADVYQIPEFKIIDGMDQLIPGGKRYWFKVRAPYRMKNCAITFRLTGEAAKNTVPHLYLARDARATGNCYALPITEIFSGKEGRGEYQNPEEKIDWGRFFHVEIPCGGNGCFRLELNSRECDIELWAYGCESRSRNFAQNGPDIKNIIPVPQYPLGFPCCSRLEITGSEEEIIDNV
jgi:hypothetical protein